MKFHRKLNSIKFPMHLSINDISEISAALHIAIDERKLKDIHFDLGRCVKAEPEFMLALCAMCHNRRADGVSFEITLPEDKKMRRLFVNTNWVHHISPEKFNHRPFEGHAQVPATYFSNKDEQYAAIKKNS